MAVQNWDVGGVITATGTDITGQKSVIEVRTVNSILSYEAVTEQVKGLKDGSNRAQNLATITTDETWTFELQVADVDWKVLQLLRNEVAQVSASFTRTNDYFLATVPAASTYVIANALITSGLTVADVQVSITAAGAWGNARSLEVLTTGTPTVDQVVLDAAGGDLTFAAGNASAPVKVAITKTLTNAETLGVESDPRTFDGCVFTGIATSTNGIGVKERYAVIIDGMTPEGGWSLEFGSPAGEKSLTYTANVTGANRSPVQMALIVE
jgi:hypothetical protein